ncbi:MAG: DUF1576 domain-containing protein [Anaerorhabdus sp.]
MEYLNCKNRVTKENYQIIWIISSLFVFLAFIVNTPLEIADGLLKILFGRAILISDYMVIGNLGSALVNASINAVVCVLLLKITKTRPTGAIIAGVLMNIGFGLFGKNIVNSLPIFLGIYFYSKLEKLKFSEYIIVSLLGTTLGPIISEFVYFDSFATISSDVFGILLGIILGFVLVPISRQTYHVHKGYCTFNVGFAAGSLAMLFTFILKAFGVEIESQLHWYTQHQTVLISLMILIGLIFIVYGYIISDKSLIHSKLKDITKETGIMPSDFLIKYGSVCYINMGFLCILGTLLLYLIGGDFNGPTIGGILTITAFGSVSNNYRNCIPVLLGATLCSMLHIEAITSPTTTLAILFSVGVAPIAGNFGFFWGVAAGFIHITLATNMGSLNSGLNLYNNGFAAGFVCLMIVPVIESFKNKKKKEEKI